MTNPLFSTYRQGENRVTGSLLAVFERISFALVEQILQQMLEEPEVDLLTFTNQAARRAFGLSLGVAEASEPTS